MKYPINPLLNSKKKYISSLKKKISSVKSELSRFSRDGDGILRMRKDYEWKYGVEGYYAELKGTLNELRSMLKEVLSKKL